MTGESARRGPETITCVACCRVAGVFRSLPRNSHKSRCLTCIQICRQIGDVIQHEPSRISLARSKPRGCVREPLCSVPHAKPPYLAVVVYMGRNVLWLVKVSFTSLAQPALERTVRLIERHQKKTGSEGPCCTPGCRRGFDEHGDRTLVASVVRVAGFGHDPDCVCRSSRT